jgi:hypothetical protein
MFQSSTFRAAVSLSGYYRARSDRTTGSLWDGSKPLRDLNDLEWRLAHQPVPPVSLLLTIGTEELGPYGIRDTERFLHLVHWPMTVETVFGAGGRHTFFRVDEDAASVVPLPVRPSVEPGAGRLRPGQRTG